MNLQQWFSLEILHEYFDKEICTVFELFPMIKTQLLMKNYAIFIQLQSNKCIGYVDVADSKNSWEELQGADDLFFQLVNTDMDFNNYTNTPLVKDEGSVLYLTNLADTSAEQSISTSTYLAVQSLIFQVNIPSALPVLVVVKNSIGQDIFTLQTQKNQSNLSLDLSVFGTGIYELWVAGVLSKTFIGTTERIRNDCYGILHLQMAPILASLIKHNMPLFKINFMARATYWEYVVIVSQDKKITIQDINIESVDNEAYSGPETIMIGGEEARLFTAPNVKKLHERARASPLLKMQYHNDFSDDLLDLEIKMPVPKPSYFIAKNENNEDMFYSQTIIYV